MRYLKKRGNIFYFQRCVPKKYKPIDPRITVIKSLETDSESEAQSLCLEFNRNLESYWTKLYSAGEKHSQDNYREITELSQHFGFEYKPNSEIAEAPLSELINRLRAAHETNNSTVTTAVMGGKQSPKMKISKALERYWELSTDQTLKKSPDQLRKWKNPRNRAIRYFIDICGDKEITEITRDDIYMDFRGWYLNRIDEGSCAPKTANKELGIVKTILSEVCFHDKVGIDIDHIFKNHSFNEEGTETQILSFETNFIKNQILNLENLKNLNEEAKLILFAKAETGARHSELIGLEPEDIVLDAPIPFIDIIPRPKRQLKTPYSKRKIPLVGHALWAFQQLPNGFSHYRNLKSGADSFSTLTNRYLRQYGLLPSENHGVNSLRHSFQDRLNDAGAIPRVDAQLMGHKFDRESYGKGASLETLQEWMLKICLNTDT